VWTAIALLLVLWIIGLLTSLTFGGLIHILLLASAVLLIYQVVRGRGIN
jgi:hypothetical protein